jgi:hypothetical protein
MKAMIFIATLLFSLPSLLHAEDTQYYFSSPFSCDEYVKILHDPDAQRERLYSYIWFTGFATGYNLGIDVVTDQFSPPDKTLKKMMIADIPDDNAFYLYIEKFCKDHPQERFSTAASALITDLRLKQKADRGKKK